MKLYLLDTTDQTAMEDVYTIYRQAMPPAERKSRSDIFSLLRRRDYAITAAENNDEIVGFSMVYRSLSARIGLLEYMATKPEARNSGIGKLLFQNALELMQGRVMLVEVEAEAGAETDRIMQRRRQCYYNRLGCKLINNLPYEMPQLNAVKPPPLVLMYHDQGRDLALSRQLLENWISTIYTDIYAQEESSNAIEKMIAAWENAGAGVKSGSG